jgi:hypothetical protein
MGELSVGLSFLALKAYHPPLLRLDHSTKGFSNFELFALLLGEKVVKI